MRLKPILITRHHIGLTASFIGAAALMIGVVGLIWQGGATLYVGIFLALGVIGIALWAILTPDEFVGFITGRQARGSTTAIFTTLLLIGVTALVYILLSRASLTLDMTSANRFTLSPETMNVLQRVTMPIRITGFYSSRSLDAREQDDEFFHLYTAASNGLITVQYINPDEQPAMAQRYGLTEDGQDYISFINQDGTSDLNSLELIPRDAEGDSQERDVTQSIARLLVSGSLSVYIDQGLGERSLSDTSQIGLSGVNNGMRTSGLATYALDISDLAKKGQDIPANAATVIFARPTSDLTSAEIAIIDRYLKRGGSLFLMPDVLFTDDRFMKQNGAFDTYLQNNYGISALDAVVVDPASSGKTALDIVGASVDQSTDIGQRLDNKSNAPIFSIALALDVNQSNPPPNVTNGVVVASSNQSYGETDFKSLGETNTYHYDQGKDLPGPLATVAWASNSQTKAKIVLVGDSDFITNGLVESGGNGILFTDAMSWLSGLSDLIHFAPKLYGVGMPLFLTSQNLEFITFLTVILMPGAVLVTGLAIWLRRARR